VVTQISCSVFYTILLDFEFLIDPTLRCVGRLKHVDPNKVVFGVYKTGGLDRTSEFVYARLGPDGVQSGHKGVY
jgi:hypothetical protein